MAHFRTAENNKSVKCSCVVNLFSCILWAKLASMNFQNYENDNFLVFFFFFRFVTFPHVFRQTKAWLFLELHKIRRVKRVVSCSISFLFYLWARLAERSVESYKKLSFFSIFSRLCLFPQVFGHTNEWRMLELQKIIRVSNAVACSIVVVVFYEQGFQGGMFKLMKHVNFLVIVAVWVLFPKFLSRLRSGLY